MKKTELAKQAGLKINNRLNASATPPRFGVASAEVSQSDADTTASVRPAKQLSGLAAQLLGKLPRKAE